ncbi:ADP-forming succinate--CoA ligase subunit beta [Caldisericum exile]|uniref:Succinate--CoA ligase [ADP-forming] subunit beta n=1 Tax=Caldisericum exile (strain DSM 21853 / NBRC 104410 / AZM16c01) TaxID=511051 RepID=A0A7U6GF06_CALEA|nr:ADP-forming succinate--CoA ligase subunit beta [Caldisericum exile]BAL81146.1 succinyl-CoA synthetase beta subunit [Caldisericum exile AZM16c01]
MNLQEYQSREFFERFGIQVVVGDVASNPEEALGIAKKIGLPVVLKAQVLVGGRGKAGGVKVAKTEEDVLKLAGEILSMEIKGLKVRKLLVAKAVNIVKEFYVGFTVDRGSKKNVLIVSEAGGVDIEEVAKNTPEKIYKIYIDPIMGLFSYEAKKASLLLTRDMNIAPKIADIIERLYKVYISLDANLAEINPLAVVDNSVVLALDAKIVIDDNAMFRHPELEDLREPTEEEKLELEAKSKGFTYIKLNGNIGCLVNGAGLAMATMDLIKLFGGEPANFLDIGGSSSPDKVANAIEMITRDKNVKAILINIFGGITRCDDVANGLLKALDMTKVDVPIVVRLTGTNEDKAKEILKDTPLIYTDSMVEGVKKVVEVANAR